MPAVKITHITQEDIALALKKFRGNVAQCARELEMSRTWVQNRIEENEKLKEILRDERESMLDNAETVLYKKVIDGNDTLLIFYLKTQGYKRGYGRQGDYDPESSKSKIILVDRDGTLRVVRDDSVNDRQ